jgi:hypothetical protein
MQRSTIVATALAISLGSPASAQPPSRCTHETLSVRGTPLVAAYCIDDMGSAPPGRDLPIRVSETYSTSHGSFTQQATLRFISGEQASRVIEDVVLDRLGLDGTLHLTLLLHAGLIHIDSAMLTPGAITIK